MTICRYIIGGRTYSAIEFEDYLRKMEPQEASRFMHGVDSLPPSPFQTTWPQLAMKRITKWAVDHGFDRVAWVPGDVQAERYDLSKQVDRVTYAPASNHLRAWKNGGVVLRQTVPPDKLADHIGKDAAEKLLKQPIKSEAAVSGGKPEDVHALSGLDLKVGGEGMKGFYDKILPAEVQKIIGKFGGKVGRSDVGVQYADRDAVKPDEIATREHDAEWQSVVGRIREIEAGRRPHSREVISETEPLYRELDRIHGQMVSETMARGAQQTVHSFDITPEMRRAVQSEGLALFEERRPLGRWGRLRRGR